MWAGRVVVEDGNEVRDVMLHYLARRHETTVDEVLTRELEDVACAHAEELSEALPGFANAFGWP